MRKNLALTATILLLSVAMPGFGQEANDPRAILARLDTAAERVIACGKAAEQALVSARRTVTERKDVSDRPAILVTRKLSAALRKLDPPSALPKDAELATRVQSLVTDLVSFLATGEEGLPALAPVLEAASGPRKEFLEDCKRGLFLTAVINEVKSFMVNGQASGTYDGMFEKTSKFGRDGALAMREVFVDIGFPDDIRTLCGEGVAQLGSKEDIPSVREVFDDDVEEKPVKNKAMFVLARLGDRGPFDARLAELDASIAKGQGILDAKSPVFKELSAEIKALSGKEDKSDDDKAKLKEKETEFRKINGELIEATYGVGFSFFNKAQMFIEIRDYEQAQASYEKTISFWQRIASVMQGTAQAKGNMSLVYYNLACALSRQGKLVEATKSMESAFQWGYSNYDWLEKDGDLAALRADPAFQTLLADMKSGAAEARWKKAREEAPKPAPEKKPSGDTGSGGS
jgi:hypothetical protein